jgi:hypothetical protein
MTIKRYQWRNKKYTADQLARLAGVSLKTMKDRLSRYRGDMELIMAQRGSISRRGYWSFDGEQVVLWESMKTRRRGQGTFKVRARERGWIGCDFCTSAPGTNRRIEWQVIDHKRNGTLICECTKGEPEEIGVWREFDPLDWVITTYLPTPEEIRAEALKIQESWNAKEEEQRRVEGPGEIGLRLFRSRQNGTLGRQLQGDALGFAPP